MAKLAVKGGRPLLEGKTIGKPWPLFDETDREALIRVLEGRVWCPVMCGDQSKSEVGGFEIEFARYQDARHGCAVTNGTTAIEVALLAGDVKPGDEVIVPAASFIATAMAVSHVGAVPVFVDVDAETYTLSPQAAEAAVTPKTRAIVPVHLGGYPADMEAIRRIAEKHALLVVEDCAHVHGTIWDGRKFPVTDMGTFSFQQGKTLTAGEGGIVLTDNAELAGKVHSLSSHGRLKGHPFYEHHLVGSNLRMTEFQGALLRAQLARLDEQIKHRDTNAIYLAAGLEQIDGLRAIDRDERLTQWGFYHWNFKFLPEAWDGIDKMRFIEAAAAEGLSVGGGIHVDPMYLNPMYTEGHAPYRKHDCPNCEYAWKQGALSFGHAAFLGPRSDMDLILETFRKIWDNRDELRS